MTNPLEKEEASGYRTPGSVIDSAASIVEKISTLKAEIVTQYGNYGLESFDGESVAAVFDDILDDVKKVHVDFMEDHLEARFRRIERRLGDDQ